MHFSTFKNSCLLIGAILAFGSCKNDPDSAIPDDVKPENNTFGVTVIVEAAGESYDYVIPVNDLMEDTKISPVGKGIDITGMVDGTYGIITGSTIFTPDGQAIKKYSFAAGRAVEQGNTVITQPESYSSYMMKSYFYNNRLNFVSWATKYNEQTLAKEKRFYIIDTADMLLKGETALSFPVPNIEDPDNPGKYFDKSAIPISPTSLGIANGKVYVGFLYLKPNWGAPEKQIAYVLTADYPSLANQKITSTDKYGHNTGTWYQTRSSFLDEDGNYYFTTIKENKYYTLLRIKAGSTEIDPDYVFDLSNYGLYLEGYMGQQADNYVYIKNGQAKLGAYIFDVHNKTIVKNLNDAGLGAVQYVHGDGLLVDGSNLYVIVKTAASKYYVARYNTDTKELVRGLEIDGGITAVRGISKY